MSQRIRDRTMLELTNAVARVLMPEQPLDELYAALQVLLVAQERLIELERQAFWLAADLASVLAFAEPVLELRIVAEAERVPADQWRAVHRSVDRRA